MTGKQLKVMGMGAAFLALWICCVAYIETRAQHRAKSVEKISPPPAPEAEYQKIAAAEAERLDREHQARLAADAEAAREEQALQVQLVTNAQAVSHEEPPVELGTAIASGAPGSEHKLSGIMRAKGKYMAIMNKNTYQAGDKLGNGKILGIEAGEVTVEIAAGNIVKLRVGDSITVPTMRGDAAVLPAKGVTRPVARSDAAALPPGLRQGLIAYYPFNRNEGRRVSDVSDARRDATAENVAWTAHGKVGGAMIFNSTGSRIVASDQGLPEGDAPRSIAFWENTGSKNEILVCMLTYGKQGRGQQCGLGMDWRVGRSGINVSPGGSCNVSGKRLENERWYHVAYCYGGGGKHTLYIDGVAEPLAVREFSTFNTQLAGELMLGDSDKQAPSFDGCLDEVMIYDRVLSPAEVRQIYERR